MGEYQYILVDAYQEMMNDTFLVAVNNELLKIYAITLPDMYIRDGCCLVKKYHPDIERKIEKLEELKADYIEMHYKINE